MEKMEFEEGKQEAEDITSYVEEVKQVEEVLYDPVDEIVVEDCCPAVCYVRYGFSGNAHFRKEWIQKLEPTRNIPRKKMFFLSLCT